MKFSYSRIFINELETLIIFDKDVHLVATKEVDEFLRKQYLHSLSILIYSLGGHLISAVNYYDEATNSFYLKNFLQVNLFSKNTKIKMFINLK